MKMSAKNNYLTIYYPLLAICLMSLMSSLYSSAQAINTDPDSEVVADLGTSVVTASRVQQSVLDTPASVSVIDYQEISDRSLRTVPDALRYTSGVMIQKTTYGHGSPYIRGFTGRQNLLLVDGIRMNNSTYRSGPVQYWNTLDANAISRMELVKGPRSTLYGSDALGGALNVISKDTGYLDERGRFYGGTAYYKYDSNSKSHVGRIEQRFGVGGKWGMMLGVSGKDYGDIKDSNQGRMERSGYREENLDFKFQYALNSSTQLSFAHQYLNQDGINRWHRLEENSGWIHDDHVTQGGVFKQESYDQERSLTYLRVDGMSDYSLLENWQATLSFQKSQDSTARVDDRLRARNGNVDVETYGFSFQGNGELKEGELVWGLDYYHDEVDSDGNESRRRPVADQSSYDTLGAFAQYKYNLNEKLSVTAGVRASYFKAKWGESFDVNNLAISSGEDDWSNLTFNLGANYYLTERDAIFGSISQGFRAPNLDDLTSSSSALSGVDTIGSTGLDPEHVVSFELGYKRGSDSIQLTTSMFYTKIDDQITSVLDGRVLRIQNGESAYVYGVEIEGQWNFADDWSLRGALTWQDGKQDLGGGIEDTISRLAPFSGVVAVKWTHPSDQFWIEGSILAAATQDNLSDRDTRDDQRIPTNGTPGYIVGSIRAGYQVNESLELNLGLENLTDEDYRVHGSGINETGFNTVIGLKYTW